MIMGNITKHCLITNDVDVLNLMLDDSLPGVPVLSEFIALIGSKIRVTPIIN